MRTRDARPTTRTAVPLTRTRAPIRAWARECTVWIAPDFVATASEPGAVPTTTPLKEAKAAAGKIAAAAVTAPIRANFVIIRTPFFAAVTPFKSLGGPKNLRDLGHRCEGARQLAPQPDEK